jgi:glucokinase
LAAKRGDRVAIGIIQSTGRRLGAVLAILVDLLNPERIVIGGLAIRLGDLLLDPARSVMRREALAPAAASCEIVPAALDERIGDVAALCVALGF